MSRPRFLADNNVGRLARWLRILGYDAEYLPRLTDSELVRAALAERRILLTRDLDLTHRRVVANGLVHAVLLAHDSVERQLRQVFSELNLDDQRALTRCLECNALLETRTAAAVAACVPPFVRATQSRYSQCPTCGRIYWQGTHWSRMRARLAEMTRV